MKMSKKIFISYDYDNDKHYKNMLRAWNANKQFEFSFYDNSVDISVDSKDKGVIRRVVSSKINKADCFLCLVGEHTHKSSWVKWEIQKAVKLEKEIVAVKISKSNISPDEILNVNAKWTKFGFDSIKEAIDGKDNDELSPKAGMGILFLIGSIVLMCLGLAGTPWKSKSLVSEKSSYDSCSLLCKNGFIPELNLDKYRFESYKKFEDHLILFTKNYKYNVELHWELSGKYNKKPIIGAMPQINL